MACAESDLFPGRHTICEELLARPALDIALQEREDANAMLRRFGLVLVFFAVFMPASLMPASLSAFAGRSRQPLLLRPGQRPRMAQTFLHRWGQSYNNVASGRGSFSTVEGYRFATGAEIRDLFARLGGGGNDPAPICRRAGMPYASLARRSQCPCLTSTAVAWRTIPHPRGMYLRLTCPSRSSGMG